MNPDDTRIRAAIPTIEYLTSNSQKVILAAHLVQGSKRKDEIIYYKRLGDILGKNITLTESCIGDESISTSSSLENGEVLLLENIRFYEEGKNNLEFAKSWPHN